MIEVVNGFPSHKFQLIFYSQQGIHGIPFTGVRNEFAAARTEAENADLHVIQQWQCCAELTRQTLAKFADSSEFHESQTLAGTSDSR